MIFKIVLINLIKCVLMICVVGNPFDRSSVETRHCLVSTDERSKSCDEPPPTIKTRRPLFADEAVFNFIICDKPDFIIALFPKSFKS